jgi:hypothetical protein
MDIELSKADLSFEAEVREFLAGNAYKDGEDPNKWRIDWFEKAKAKGNWDVPKWPAKFGGPGWHRISITSGKKKPPELAPLGTCPSDSVC